LETEKHLTDIQRAGAAMGRKGGRSTSPAKKAASRKNGSLSVRPKRAAEQRAGKHNDLQSARRCSFG
jgi:hypothetical protein